nr:hypothetical protein [uncultured Roseobacter sp.]
MVTRFFDRGWGAFPPERVVREWAQHALKYARRAVAAPENSHLLQCDGTWFVGLDALENDAVGRVGDSPPLAGRAVDFATRHCGGWPTLHRAQISVTYPGYPRARAGESAAAFRYRVDRDAAHVDGIIGLGTPKRRFVKEPHAFVLGLPLSQADVGAAPLVVWEGSHKIIQAAMQRAFEGYAEADLSDVDVTEIYQNARREAFERCARVQVHGEPGSAYLIHRLALHGVAPWAAGATASADGRMIAYFRPELVGGVAQWAHLP